MTKQPEKLHNLADKIKASVIDLHTRTAEFQAFLETLPEDSEARVKLAKIVKAAENDANKLHARLERVARRNEVKWPYLGSGGDYDGLVTAVPMSGGQTKPA